MSLEKRPKEFCLSRFAFLFDSGLILNASFTPVYLNCFLNVLKKALYS